MISTNDMQADVPLQRALNNASPSERFEVHRQWEEWRARHGNCDDFRYIPLPPQVPEAIRLSCRAKNASSRAMLDKAWATYLACRPLKKNSDEWDSVYYGAQQGFNSSEKNKFFDYFDECEQYLLGNLSNRTIRDDAIDTAAGIGYLFKILLIGVPFFCLLFLGPPVVLANLLGGKDRPWTTLEGVGFFALLIGYWCALSHLFRAKPESPFGRIARSLDRFTSWLAK